MKKRWVRIVIAIVGLFVLAIVVVPFLVNADTFRPTVQDQLSSALGRRVTLGHLSFSLLSGSLIAAHVSFYPAGVSRVDLDSGVAQFVGEMHGQSVERGFAGIVGE